MKTQFKYSPIVYQKNKRVNYLIEQFHRLVMRNTLELEVPRSFWRNIKDYTQFLPLIGINRGDSYISASTSYINYYKTESGKIIKLSKNKKVNKKLTLVKDYAFKVSDFSQLDIDKVKELFKNTISNYQDVWSGDENNKLSCILALLLNIPEYSEMFFRVNSRTKGRDYSRFVNLKREIRHNIKYKGKLLKEIDIVSAHPTFFLNFIEEKGIYIEEEVKTSIREGKFKEFCKKYSPRWMHNDIKTLSVSILNTNDKRAQSYQLIEVLLLSGFAHFVNALNLYAGRELNTYLTQTEGKIMNIILEDIQGKSELILRLHDCLYCLEGDEEEINAIANNRVNKLGIKLKVKN